MVVKNIKAVIAVAALLGFQTNVALAQDAETKEEKPKKEKKVKEEKDDGKIAKSGKGDGVIKYRRSSLHTMIIEDAKLPDAELILNSFSEAPFPDKYNDHTVGAKSFDLEKYYVAPTVAEGEKAKKKDAKNYAPTIDKYIKENHLAREMVAKWFNRSPEGTFDINLIGERGMYDASAQDKAKANSTERGEALLADAGEDLIGNSFVVVNYSKFVANEPIAKAARDVSYSIVANANEVVRKVGQAAADKLYEKTKDGYSVWTTAYLYQLQWTDSMSAVFYQDLWNDASAPDPARVEAFNNSELFELKLLGSQKAKSLITGLGSNADDKTMIIKNATVKSIDAVYAKLQRKFEPFRTKTPLTSVDPLGAKIGLKEGLEAGDEYEVLVKTVDAEGKVKWKRKSTIKVAKGKIWNNVATDENAPLVDDKGEPVEDSGVEFTHFKGKKGGLYPGMLLRQIK